MKKTNTICLDPGHGPGTVNGSPDGTYKELEFTWDMYQRIRPLLESQGFTVIGTRGETDKPGLHARARVSNGAATDLFLSIHSNASGSAGWSSPSGLLIFTSRADDQAERNKAARAVISQMKAAGIALHGSGLAHNRYTVLTATTAPAILIEYGFHTNKGDVELLKDPAYRDKLAQATVKGICNYFSVAYDEEDKEEGTDDPSPWHKDSWEKATKKGILDGTMPKEPCTREMLAAVLNRLGLL